MPRSLSPFLHSGGNKRKLSTAIALVGNPPIVLLVGVLYYHGLMCIYFYMYKLVCLLHCHHLLVSNVDAGIKWKFITSPTLFKNILDHSQSLRLMYYVFIHVYRQGSVLAVLNQPPSLLFLAV